MVVEEATEVIEVIGVTEVREATEAIEATEATEATTEAEEIIEAGIVHRKKERLSHLSNNNKLSEQYAAVNSLCSNKMRGL